MSIKRLHYRAGHPVLVLVFGLFAIGATAAEWSREASISAGGVYTDNVELDDNDKEGEFIATATPRISLEGEANRASLDLDAAVQFNDLSGGRTDNVNPRLDADGEVELVQSHLFLEADASAYQAAVDPFSATGGSSLNRSGNSLTTYNYGITPVFRTRLADFANLELRYRYDEQRFGGERSNELDESTQETTSFSLNSGELFSRFTWSLSGDIREIEFSEDREITDPLLANRNDDIERKTLRFSPSYRLSRKWQLTGTIGKEWNDFTTGDRETDDDFWNAGFVWTPNLRTTVRAGYGERFFGTTPYAEIEHRTRRTTLSLGYSRDLTDTRNLRRRDDVIPDLDPFGDPIDPITGEPLPLDAFFTSRANSVVVNERWDATFTVKGNRTTIRLSARQSNQSRRDLIGEDSSFRFLQASVERSLSARLNANARISLDEREREDTQTGETESSDILRISFGANYELGPRTRVNVLYTHSRADQGLFSREYQENRISVSLTYQFL
jgi:uncharacterized protein (PEP-CTERM system associated)